MSSPDIEPALRDSTVAEQAGQLLAQVALSAETPKQLDNALEDANEALDGTGLKLVRKDEHDAEYDMALQTKRLLELGVAPASLPLKATIILLGRVLDLDAKSSKITNDKRTFEEKQEDKTYYKRLFAIEARNYRGPRPRK